MDQLKLYFNNPVLQQLLIVVGSVLIILFIARLIKGIIPKYIPDTNRRYRMRKFVTYLTYMIVVILILVIYSNKITGLTVFLGVAGAGIAFALQEIIASIAGFIAINFSNFYNVGDRVMLGGIKGDVIDIGFLRTSIMQIGDWVNGDLYNGKIVSISNSFIFKEPVFNYSGDFPFLWDEVNIPIKTEGDYKYAKETFQNILDEVQGDYARRATVKWAKMTEKYQLENAQVMPMVTMSFDENWINFNLRFVVDYKRRRGTKDIISQKVLDAIRNSNGRMEVASAAMNITLLK
ncbi:MAG: mechanosensitive ion channel [Saprospiraceae bacterium]|nr:mechanosensitive ion channel [Saprospiraceae bacterium]